MVSAMDLTRRMFVGGAIGLASCAWWRRGRAATDLAPVHGLVDRKHDESVQRLQTWVRQPSVSTDGTGITECCALTMRFLREAGFDRVDKVDTAGHPGIFAT